MRKTLLGTTLFIAACAQANAQAIRVVNHNGATDIWGKYYTSGNKLTFTGKVTGIVKTLPDGGYDDEVTLLVQNKDGGGTSVVDLGPTWYVDRQVAKIKLKDKVRVTGSKVLVDGHGVVLASQILVNGRGGLVVSLRRQSGRAFWMGTETDPSITVPAGPNVRSGQLTGFSTYTINNVPYTAGVLQTDNGTLNIDLGPQWYYNRQNTVYRIGDNLSVVSGPVPFQIGPGNQIYQSYSIYRGQQVYNIRDQNGNPMYYWGQ